ncbi:F-box only protein 21 isoform X1 [Camponotus floridanus]|uniref:F-box only protein 21 isoform X1 n=1 Tax=Camponotus floridanus TaxID=104421 RepID=UPI000DC6AC84|nr:F-box only protein 21 isoform X1 [Camponotus floridanus]
MATIISLPDEVIDVILEDENISIKDAVSFMSTCKQFYEMIHSKKFWEKKFYQRCPSARKKYNTEKREKIFKHLDFKEKLKTNIKCIKSLQHYVHLMSNNNLSDTDKKELGHLLIFIAEDSMTYYFVLDEINTIIPPHIYLWSLDPNLTIIYNFDRINNYLRQYRFIYKLNKFLNMSKEKRLFERLIIIMTQHCQPCVSYSVIKTFLDDMAYEVFSLVKNKYPKHSLFSTSPEQISFWRDNNIERNFWNRTEAMQIIEILDEFMSELGYCKLNKLLKTLDIACEFVIDFLDDSEFKKTITYQCVARRLGIYCCSTYADFHIDNWYKCMWKPKYNIEDMELGEYYFKDYHAKSIAFYNATRELPYTVPSDLNNIKEIRVMICCLYESLKYENYASSVYVSRLLEYSLDSYLDQWFGQYKNINEVNIEAEYINITESIGDRPDIFFERSEDPKRRNEEIKFAIGMIIKHTPPVECNINGVIVGWHYECDSVFTNLLNQLDDIDPISNLNHPLISGNLYLLNKLTTIESCFCRESRTTDCMKQPHYLILTDSNQIRYVEQNTICSTNKRLEGINNVEIGRYFTRFEDTHYVPNENLAKLYPDDAAAILEIPSR